MSNIEEMFRVLLFCLVFNFVRSELLLTHIIFRHGEKTPDNFVMYPSDPYINHTYYPYGPGQLTNRTYTKNRIVVYVDSSIKRTMYNLGKILRGRYDQFLGDLYEPSSLDSWSSNFDRCQSSLQLVLASLFPPKDIPIWNGDLNWQPIPYRILPRKQDNLFLSILLKDYVEEYNQYCLAGAGKEITEESTPIFSYIQAHTNTTIRTLRDLLLLSVVLVAEESYGLPLPDWTKDIYPQPLQDLLLVEYQLQMGTKSLKKKLIGRLLEKILEDSENRIVHQSSYKLHLYAAHDMTIMWMLSFLGLVYDHHPGYGACLVLELHEENGRYFLEVHYKDDKHSHFKLLHFSNGKRYLRLSKFRDMVLDLLEKDEKAIASSASTMFGKQAIYPHIIILIVSCYCAV